jgi:protease I
MAQKINGLRVAALAADGGEQVELTKPVAALREAGAAVTVVSLKAGRIQGMNHDKPGDKLPVDAALSDVKPGALDALLLPGGVANPDTLRTDPRAVAFVKHFAQVGKPIGAICHGPWTLIEADAVRGHTMTSWPSLKTDLTNAGATWVDQECVVDGMLVTSRNPHDIPAFNAQAIFACNDGAHDHPKQLVRLLGGASRRFGDRSRARGAGQRGESRAAVRRAVQKVSGCIGTAGTGRPGPRARTGGAARVGA